MSLIDDATHAAPMTRREAKAALRGAEAVAPTRAAARRGSRRATRAADAPRLHVVETQFVDTEVMALAAPSAEVDEGPCPWILSDTPATPAPQPAAPVVEPTTATSWEPAPVEESTPTDVAVPAQTEVAPVVPLTRREARRRAEEAQHPSATRRTRGHHGDPAEHEPVPAKPADPQPVPDLPATDAPAPGEPVPAQPVPTEPAGDEPPTVQQRIVVVPLSRREARAQHAPQHAVTAPVAPAVTAAVLLLTATGAAATSNGIDAISGTAAGRPNHSRQLTDPEGTTRAEAVVDQDQPEAEGAPESQPLPGATVARDAARPALPAAVTAPPAPPSPSTSVSPTITPVTTQHPRIWSKPVGDYYISSGFGWRWGRLHAGIDYAGPADQPIRAVGAGTIIDMGYEELRGNAAYLRLEDGTVLVYAHLNRLDVTMGQKLMAGDQIGLLGSTGNSTGPHLHFEVHPHNGDAIDPEPWLRERGLL